MLIKDKKGNFVEGSFISISGDMSTVASTSVQSQPWQPFLWTGAGGVKNLPVPGGSQSCRVLSLSTDGKSAFGIQVDKSGEGVLWRNGRIANPFPARFQPKAMAQDGETFAGVVDGEVAFWSKPLGIHKIGDLHPKWAGFAVGVEQVRTELIKVQKGSIAIAGRSNREDAWWMQIPLSRL